MSAPKHRDPDAVERRLSEAYTPRHSTVDTAPVVRDYDWSGLMRAVFVDNPYRPTGVGRHRA